MNSSSGAVKLEVIGDAERMYGISGLPFVPAVRVPAGHDLIFLSGVLGPPASADEPTDMRSEAQRVFQQVKHVLAEAGASFADVVSVQKFVVDIERNNEIVAEVMSEYFVTFPTSTTVEVPRLVPDGLRLEVSAIAALPARN